MREAQGGLPQRDAYEPVQGATLADVASHVKLPDPTQSPNILLAVAPCRSGTTTQLRVFAQAGMQAHYQPLKAVLRSLMHGEQREYEIPAASNLFIKETIGPYTQTESEFNPVEVLLLAGYPKDKLHVLVEMREPLSTLASWYEMFSFNRDRETLFQNFMTAYRTVGQTRTRAIDQGVPVTTYVYEAQRDNEPAKAVSRLFADLGLPYSDSVVRGWENLPSFGTVESGIYFPPEPEIYSARSFHDTASTATELGYFPKSSASLDREVPEAQARTLRQSDIPAIYDQMKKAAERQLHLRIRRSQEMQDYTRRHRRTGSSQ